MDEIKPKKMIDSATGKDNRVLPTKAASSNPPQKKTETAPQTEVFSINLKEVLNLHPDPEINDMLNRMYQMREDIQTKLNDIYDKAGVSANQVKNFLDNPSNFPPDIWQRIQSQRDMFEKKISEVLSFYGKKKTKSHVGGAKGGISKERKSKTLGSRRNWIPM